MKQKSRYSIISDYVRHCKYEVDLTPAGLGALEQISELFLNSYGFVVFVTAICNDGNLFGVSNTKGGSRSTEMEVKEHVLAVL